MPVTTTVEGRERFTVLVRYPRDLRDTPDALRRILVPVQLGAPGAGALMAPAAMPAPLRTVQVPLGLLADVHVTSAPMQVRTENAFLSW